jgi:hypothetical protein
MMDMSTAEKTSLDIFKGIMDWGPLTLYSANAKTRMPIGTIHRHIKLLEKTGKIKAYESKTTVRSRLMNQKPLVEKKFNMVPQFMGFLAITVGTKNFPLLFKIIFYYGLSIKNFKTN